MILSRRSVTLLKRHQVRVFVVATTIHLPILVQKDTKRVTFSVKLEMTFQVVIRLLIEMKNVRLLPQVVYARRVEETVLFRVR
jgi:Leu/Phe-tRNA-protein transferase